MIRAFRNKLPSRLGFAVFFSFLISVLVITMRATGAIQPFELAAYDWLFRLRPTASERDLPIVLVTITESDIQTFGYPLPDSTLAKTLKRLTTFEAAATGLDIYRDSPVPPGQEELEEFFKKNWRTIAIMKLADESTEGIRPPTAIENQQVGFSDMLIDPDGIVRRGLLFLDDGKSTSYSFGLRLALLYLERVGIGPQPDASNPRHMRLGRTTIPPLEANSGGYLRGDARGYQFLLDFKEARHRFPSFTITALLSENIDPAVFKGKIVLIGMVAESVPHKFYTPVSGLEAGDSISGLALHAQIISQLLRFALEGSPPIKTLNEPIAAPWILLSGLLGGIVGLRMSSVWRFSVAVVAGLLLLGVGAYAAFLYAWWIPLVPPALTWFASATLVTVYISNRERTQAHRLIRWSGSPSRRVSSTVLFADLLDSTAGNYRIRVGVYAKSDEGEKTLRRYDDHNVVWSDVEGACHETIQLLNRANQGGKMSPHILNSLQKTGNFLFELLIPQKAREKLCSAQTRELLLNIDDRLIQIPWELLFDGREFLCRRFAMGRIVNTRQVLTAHSERVLKLPFKVLVLADPKGDHDASYSEGIAVRDFLDERREMFRVDSKMRSVSVAFVQKNLRDYDIVHYAGHANYHAQRPSDSGWRLTDGTLTAGEISAMGGLQPMPSLVFSHACQTGHSDWHIVRDYEQQIFGVANAYLLAGVQHYIGTFWEILDQPSLRFAKSFYKFLTEGETIGEAVRRARLDLIGAYGEETVVWASYMLYGDPTFKFGPG